MDVISTPLTARRLYLAIDGQPQGPYDVSQVQDLLHRGMVPRESLIWQEGSPAWMSLTDFFALSGQVIGVAVAGGNPSMPAASVPAPARAALELTPRTRRTYAEVDRGDQTRYWRLAVLGAALGLYFIPWIGGGSSHGVSQTGFQVVTGGVTLNSAAFANADGPHSGTEGLLDEFQALAPGGSVPGALALVFLCGALGTATKRSLAGISGIAAAISLGLLVYQESGGFPLSTTLTSAVEQRSFDSKLPAGPLISATFISDVAELNRGSAWLKYYQVTRRGWYFLEFGMLGWAAVMALVAARKQMKLRRDG